MSNFLKLCFLENDLVGSEYVEPFAGGASVALSLLYEDYATHIHINDIDRSVFAFWYAVLHRTDELCSLIANCKVTVEEWQIQKSVQTGTDPDDLELAFSTFFLNRTNRSGIISGGIIGGQEQTGAWKLDARFSRDNLIQRVKKVARFRNRITLTQLDVAQLLPTWTQPTDIKTVLYLDPPYYVKGEGLYQNFYQHQHHVEIANLVEQLTVPWIVSYDSVPEILNMYSGHEALHYGLSYSAAERYRGREIMFFSPDFDIPDVAAPACVPAKDMELARRTVS